MPALRRPFRAQEPDDAECRAQGNRRRGRQAVRAPGGRDARASRTAPQGRGENCDYVGPRFAEEARRIHYGETDSHAIYGETTPKEARALTEEGIEFGRIPWAPRLDS